MGVSKNLGFTVDPKKSIFFRAPMYIMLTPTGRIPKLLATALYMQYIIQAVIGEVSFRETTSFTCMLGLPNVSRQLSAMCGWFRM